MDGAGGERKVQIGHNELEHLFGSEKKPREERQLWDNTLDFYMQYTLQLQNSNIQKCYYIARSSIAPDLCRNLNKNKTKEEKIKWGAQNLCSSNKSENTLVLPYHDGKKGHWSLFILEPNRTLYFDSKPTTHEEDDLKEFAELARGAWPLAKVDNCNTLAASIDSIVRVPVPEQESSWECGYLVVEYFKQYLEKRGNDEHGNNDCVKVSSETCCHHVLTTISNIF